MNSRLRTSVLMSLLICLSTMISGCLFDNGLERQLEEYRSRLARVTDTELTAPKADIANLLSYPATSQIHQQVASFNINLRQFYQLQDCELGTLVAERNTAVGKTAQPSQRFIYENALLDALGSCRQQLSDSPELVRQLSDWLAAKTAQRPALWANLIQSSEETRAAFSRSDTLLNKNDNRDAGVSVSALQFLAGVKNNRQQSLSALEQELKYLDSSRLPAKIWRTQAVIANQLNSLTTQLRPVLSEQACPAGKASEQVEILRNVFYLFFIEQIQPVGSVLNQYHYRLLPVWKAWLNDADLAESFKAYLRHHAIDGFAAYQQAIQEHVSLWQTLFARCNLSPVAPGTTSSR